MILGDFDFHSSLVRPNKAYAPPIIDADAVFAFPIAPQRLQTMGRRHSQVFQCRRSYYSLQP